jgi:hypothetical protein
MASAPSPVIEQAKKLNIPALVLSLISGAGVMSIISRLASSQPKEMLAMVGNWGPLFALAFFMLYVGDKRTGQMIEITQKNAEAQQRMADAFQQIAQKDDLRGREMELGMAMLGRNSEKVLQHMVELRGELAEMRNAGSTH